MKIIISVTLFLFSGILAINAQNVGIGTNTPASKLEVSGAGGLMVSSTNTGTGTTDWISGNFGAGTGERVVMGLLNGQPAIGAHNQALSAWAKLYINPGGAVNIAALAGSGNRMVVANASGDLSTQSITTGTVTSVSAALPLSVTNGTTTAGISISQAGTVNDGYLSAADWNTFNNKFSLPSLASGSVLFSNGTTIAQNNSKFFWDNSTNRLGIGTSSPNQTLTVNSTNPGSGTTDWIAGNFGGTAGNRVVAGILNGEATIGAHNNGLTGWAKLGVNPGGITEIGTLNVTGTTTLNGTTTINGTTNLNGTNLLNNLTVSGNSSLGGVTSVSTLSVAGSYSLPTTSGINGQVLMTSGNGATNWANPSLISGGTQVFHTAGSATNISFPSVANTWELTGYTTVTLTSSQRVAWVLTATLGANTARSGILVKVSSCYQNNTGGAVIEAPLGGWMELYPAYAANERNTMTVSGSIKPGAGTWRIGLGVNSATTGYFNYNDWYQITYWIIQE